MTPTQTVRRLTDEEKARIKASAAADPDHPVLLTDEALANMETVDFELPAAAIAKMDEVRRKRGRPAKDDAKVAVTLRIEPAVLERLKAKGDDWRSRVDAALRREVGL